MEPRRRIDQALWAVIAQAWIQGVSTRRVDQLVKALGNETGISRSTVSRICAEIDEYVAVFLPRRLDENGPGIPTCGWTPPTSTSGWAQRVASQALVVATACLSAGRREILGMAIGDAETTDFWTEFLRSLRERGLKVATAPTRPGWYWSSPMPTPALKAAVKAILPGAGWQRCRVHFARNVTQHSARPAPNRSTP